MSKENTTSQRVDGVAQSNTPNPYFAMRKRAIKGSLIGGAVIVIVGLVCTIVGFSYYSSVTSGQESDQINSWAWLVLAIVGGIVLLIGIIYCIRSLISFNEIKSTMNSHAVSYDSQPLNGRTAPNNQEKAQAQGGQSQPQSAANRDYSDMFATYKSSSSTSGNAVHQQQPDVKQQRQQRPAAQQQTVQQMRTVQQQRQPAQQPTVQKQGNSFQPSGSGTSYSSSGGYHAPNSVQRVASASDDYDESNPSGETTVLNFGGQAQQARSSTGNRELDSYLDNNYLGYNNKKASSASDSNNFVLSFNVGGNTPTASQSNPTNHKEITQELSDYQYGVSSHTKSDIGLEYTTTLSDKSYTGTEVNPHTKPAFGLNYTTTLNDKSFSGDARSPHTKDTTGLDYTTTLSDKQFGGNPQSPHTKQDTNGLDYTTTLNNKSFGGNPEQLSRFAADSSPNGQNEFSQVKAQGENHFYQYSGKYASAASPSADSAKQAEPAANLNDSAAQDVFANLGVTKNGVSSDNNEICKNGTRAQRKYVEASEYDEWTCPSCGKVNQEYVGMCACGARKPHINRH